MSYRNKTYVAFDGDNDMRSYNLMRAWKSNENLDFNFYDAHDLNTARDTSTEESIKAQLRIRMENAKQMILLIGENTKFLRKFVPWEIELARKKNIPIILTNLNQSRIYDEKLCPSAIQNGIYTISVSFQPAIIQYALNHFPDDYYKFQNTKDHDYSYVESIYERIGLR